MTGQGRPTTGAASRSLARLTIGHVQRQIDHYHESNAGHNALQEGFQQFQLPISGHAASVITWTNVDVKFQYAFHDATSQRQVPFNYPTFTHGVELTSPNPVIVTTHVARWDRQPHAAITGARIVIGAYDPTTNGVTNFKGFLHLTFQGYGAIDEFEPEPDIA